MTDLKLLTVRALRELAKKHLGAGHSRLKTKAELIAALAKAIPAEEGAPKANAKAKAVAPAPEPAVSAEPKRAPKGKGAAGSKEPARLEAIAAKYSDVPKESPAVAAKPVATAPVPVAPRAKPTEAVPPPAPVAPPVLKSVDTPLAKVIQFPAPASPTPVANGADHAREQRPSAAVVEPKPAAEKPKVATARPTPPPVHVPSADELALLAENLGELPRTYGEDDVTLMARDPHTLWISWDFAGQTERRAHEGMAHATPVLRLFDGVRLVREVEISLEARSWYIYNVIPGRKYRAEIHYVAPAGAAKQIGPTSNPIGVPPEGPSPVLDTHFVALPPIAPLPRPPAPPPEPRLAPPFPAENREQLLSLAEKMLRDELVTAEAAPPSPRRPPMPVTRSPLPLRRFRGPASLATKKSAPGHAG